jgi:hypothetical protein
VTQAGSGNEIEWLGQKVRVTNASIHQHMLAAEGLLKELDQVHTVEDKVAGYDKIFMALEDAKSHIRDDITKNLHKGPQVPLSPPTPPCVCVCVLVCVCVCVCVCVRACVCA